MFAYDVNYGDEISVVTSAEGPIVATGVTKNSGNYTFRVWMRQDAGGSALRDVVTEDAPLVVELQRRPDEHQATFTVSS
jgi:hypothetical protein